VHTHLYLPRYMEMLRQRKQVPYVRIDSEGNERIVLLPGEDQDQSTAKGRLISDEYWSVNEKLKQMNKFDIRAAVVSVANPWIDFFEAEEQINWARLLNDDLNDICKTHPGRFFWIWDASFENCFPMCS